MTGLCPHCGYDLIQDEPIERPEISMRPYGDCVFHGQRVRLTPGESAILWSLLKASGRPLPWTTLAERCGYEGEGRGVEALLHRLKNKLRATGKDVPLQTIYGVGVRWAVQ